eukprot:TRINITY_DN2403_c0_g1_i2.p1 TRINITY_DN2403_c0_g1~~TRINITY_DN2403_c0_g1_i2.p1  ORF type:complete len:468 (-),score=79.67 TRINITY_DN2403_c0_g1_i2:801-2204(-)
MFNLVYPTTSTAAQRPYSVKNLVGVKGCFKLHHSSNFNSQALRCKNNSRNQLYRISFTRRSLTGDSDEQQPNKEDENDEGEDNFLEDSPPQSAELAEGVGVGGSPTSSQASPSDSSSPVDENSSVENDHEQLLLNSQGSRLAELLLSYTPLELTDLQKEVSRAAVMAIKRVLTGTFGTLPSELYTVTVETTREVLSGLFRSALYTGYVLRNLEYRLDLHRSLLLNNEDPSVTNNNEAEAAIEQQARQIQGLPPDVVADLPEEVRKYIHTLEAQVEKSQQQQQQQIGRETGMEETGDVDQLGIPISPYGNDLLDLLRSLDPATAKALSKPSAPDTDHAFHLVIESVLSRLYPTLMDQAGELQDEMKVEATRDYLARILYWCMLLGNHGRGLEYKLSLEHAFEHINVEHPMGEGEGPGGGGILGAIGNFFFGEGNGNQKAVEGEQSNPVDNKKRSKSSRQFEKDGDELF